MAAKSVAAAASQPETLGHVLRDLGDACHHSNSGRISVGDLLDKIGRRSFGPLLLVLGVIGASPISNIPGVVAVVATLDILVAGQMVIARDHVWIPRALERRTVSAKGLTRFLRALQPTARFVDKLLWPRLAFLTRGLFFYVLALVCFLVALTLPLIEMIPLAGVLPNLVIVAFALAITAHDGLWALIALAFTGFCVYLGVLAWLMI